MRTPKFRYPTSATGRRNYTQLWTRGPPRPRVSRPARRSNSPGLRRRPPNGKTLALLSEQKIDLTRPLFNIAGEPRVRRLPRGPRVPVPLLRHLHSLRQRSRRQAPAFPDDWRLPGAGGCRRRREGG